MPFRLASHGAESSWDFAWCGSWWRGAGALLLAVIVLCAYAVYVRLVEERPVSELGGRDGWRELGAGILAGAFLLSLSIGVLSAVGAYRVTGSNGWLVALAAVPGAVQAAVLEEVVARGIIFRLVEESLGSWIALVLSAALFGLAHLANPGATLLNASAIMLEAGVLLAAAFMVTRRLWLCMGIHFAWNFTQGGIFSAAVSGESSTGLLRAQMTGPDWLTGGAFGVEASVIAVAACSAAGALLVVMAARKGEIVRPFWSAEKAAVSAGNSSRRA